MINIETLNHSLYALEDNLQKWDDFFNRKFSTTESPQDNLRYASLKELSTNIKALFPPNKDENAQDGIDQQPYLLQRRCQGVKEKYRKALNQWVLNASDSSDSSFDKLTCLFKIQDFVNEALKLNLGENAKRDFSSIRNQLYATFLNENSTSEIIKPLEIQDFLQRNGTIQIVGPSTKIALVKETMIITGCSAGAYRSQTLRALLIQQGYQVKHLISGRTAINPKEDYPNVSGLYASDLDRKSFMEVFSMKKVQQLGSHITATDDGLQYYYDKQRQAIKCKEAQKFYQQFFADLTEAHFMVFSESAPAVILQYLEGPYNDLSGIIVTFFPYYDEVSLPKDRRIKKHSCEAYRSFARVLASHFE